MPEVPAEAAAPGRHAGLSGRFGPLDVLCTTCPCVSYPARPRRISMDCHLARRDEGTTMNGDVLGPQRVGLLQHRAWDFWFAPKRFESPQLYERLGVLWIKRYVPTGGDYFRKKYGVRVIDIKSNIESLLKFEERTRLYEVIHLGAFLAFLLFSIC